MELKQQTNEGFGGLGHFLATVFTFGIYEIYWQYAAGKRLAKLGLEDKSTVYLIVGIFLPFLLNPFLMQDQVNSLT